MKKLLLGSLAIVTSIAAGTAAVAADAAVPRYKAPAPIAAPVPWTWSGFYVGGHLGGGWGTKQMVSGVAQDGFSIFTSANSVPVSGFLGGFQAGYNYQMGWVVVGIEGDFSFADVKGGGIGLFCCAEGAINVKSDYFATLTGRIGGTVDHALLYVKGGVAWTRDKYGMDCFERSALCTLTSAPDTRTGWIFGAGIEYAFTPNWSGKLEYNFMDFGTHSAAFACTGDCEPTFTLDIRQQIHAVKAGVNYRFDWGKAPMVARY